MQVRKTAIQRLLCPVLETCRRREKHEGPACDRRVELVQLHRLLRHAVFALPEISAKLPNRRRKALPDRSGDQRCLRRAGYSFIAAHEFHKLQHKSGKQQHKRKMHESGMKKTENLPSSKMS